MIRYDTISSSDFISDRNWHSNSDSLESETYTIWFGSPNRLSLANTHTHSLSLSCITHMCSSYTVTEIDCYNKRKKFMLKNRNNQSWLVDEKCIFTQKRLGTVFTYTEALKYHCFFVVHERLWMKFKKIILFW